MGLKFQIYIKGRWYNRGDYVFFASRTNPTENTMYVAQHNFQALTSPDHDTVADHWAPLEMPSSHTDSKELQMMKIQEAKQEKEISTLQSEIKELVNPKQLMSKFLKMEKFLHQNTGATDLTGVYTKPSEIPVLENESYDGHSVHTKNEKLGATGLTGVYTKPSKIPVLKNESYDGHVVDTKNEKLGATGLTGVYIKPSKIPVLENESYNGHVVDTKNEKLEATGLTGVYIKPSKIPVVENEPYDTRMPDEHVAKVSSRGHLRGRFL